MLSWEEIEAEWSAIYDSWDLCSHAYTRHSTHSNEHHEPSSSDLEKTPLYKHTDLVAWLTSSEKNVKAFMKENEEDVKALMHHYNHPSQLAQLDETSKDEMEAKRAKWAALYQNDIIKIQAPMVRCSRPPFRRLCRLWGTDLSYTHMILASSFVRSAAARHTDFTLYEVQVPSSSPSSSFRGTPASLLMTSGGEAPEDKLVVQLAANSAVEAAQAAAAVAPYCDAIDLNCGCPQRWAAQEQLGASLLQRPQVVADMVSAIRNHVPASTFHHNNSHTIPCVVKMRILNQDGYGSGASATAHQQLQQTVSFARQLEAAGAGWITLHARTPRCRSSAPVFWDAIEQLQASLSIPVVVNGGVATPNDAVAAALQCGGVGGVMAGNALLSNPACFDLDVYDGQLLGLLPQQQREEGTFLEATERLSATNGDGCSVVVVAALMEQQQRQWRALLRPCWAAGRPLVGGASYTNALPTPAILTGKEEQEKDKDEAQKKGAGEGRSNSSNLIPPPREVISDYLRLALRCDTPYPIAVQHTLRMARLYLSPAERSAVALVRSTVGLLQLMQELGIYVEGGRASFGGGAAVEQ